MLFLGELIFITDFDISTYITWNMALERLQFQTLGKLTF